MKRKFLNVCLVLVCGLIFNVMSSGPARAGCYDSCHGGSVLNVPVIPLGSAALAGDTALVLLAGTQGLTMHNQSPGNAEIAIGNNVGKTIEEDDLFRGNADFTKPGIGFRKSEHPLVACLKCGQIGKHLLHGGGWPVGYLLARGGTVLRSCRLCG